MLVCFAIESEIQDLSGALLNDSSAVIFIQLPTGSGTVRDGAAR